MSSHDSNLLVSLLHDITPIWSFLTLKDILTLSAASHEASTVLVPADSLSRILQQTKGQKTNSFIPLHKIRLPYPVPLLLFRKLLSSLHEAIEDDNVVVDLFFDERKSKGLLDLGFINLLSFNNNTSSTINSDTTAGSALRPPLIFGSADPNDPAEDDNEENMIISKNLEKFSMDEYDDFQPRHPMPKERAHRRGDSYFNSDIETVVNELGGMSASPSIDLRNIARDTLFREEDLPPQPPATGSPVTSGHKPPTGGSSVKSRILAKTRNNYPGRGSA